MEKSNYKPMLCPVCQDFYFSEWQEGDEYLEHYCHRCGWWYDSEQHENPNLTNGENVLSLNEYREMFQQKLEENPDYDYTDETYLPTPHICPVCGKYEFEDVSSFDICPYCGWEDDSLMEKESDSWAGCANDLCLNDFRKRYNDLIAKNPKYKYTKNHYGEK